MNNIKILLADDHEMLRRGLRSILESHPGWIVCGEAKNGREAVQMAATLSPNVVVMDITMPELNGLDATRKIRKALPKTEVLVLTMHESDELVRQVVAAGARGYVLKTDAGRVLVSAVESLLQQKSYFSAKVSSLVKASNASKPAATTGRLTPREREILQLLAEGRTNKEVGVALEISVKTAETHRTNIMRKLNIRSMSELVRYAIRNRIVEP